MADVVEALLRELVAEVRGLRYDLATSRQSVLSRADRSLLARLLPAIGGVFGSELFLVRELFESDAAALRVVLKGLNPKQIGRLLSRGIGQDVDGYMIQRDGSELNAGLWRIVRVPEFSSLRNLSVSPSSRSERL